MVGKLRRTAVKSSTGGSKVTNLSKADGRTGAAVAGASPASLPPRSSNKKRSSRQGRAGASAPLARGGGGDDFLGALMDNATMSRTSSLEIASLSQQGSRPRFQKRRSADALQGRASTKAKVTSTGVEGHPQLARGQSLDTATSRRGGSSLTARNALRPGTSDKREVRPLGAIPGSSSKVSGTSNHAEAGPSRKQEKGREAEQSDRQRPKPINKGKSGEPEHTPAPIAKKPAYRKVPHFVGVVRKVSNGKFFLWVHDKLHDGKPYDSAEVCAKEYDKLTRPARGSQRGPMRNFGDAKAPSHTEIPGLTPLSLSGSGGSRIAKKSLTSAYKHSSAAPIPKPMAKKASFFSPKEAPPQALRQQARPPASAPLPAQPTAASKAQLPPPPIVQSYYVSNIDLPMLPKRIESDSTGESRADKPDPDKPDSRIRWAEMEETFRPVDGLHVPNDREALPRRSGLTGGRGGRPAPDTRFTCAQTGTSLELLREDSSGVEGKASGSNAASLPVKPVAHQEVSADNAAPSSLTQNGLDATVASGSGPAPGALATPPQPAGAISRAQLDTAAPTPPLAVGANPSVRAPASGKSLRVPSPPTPPTAQVGQNTANHLGSEGSPWQQAARDMEENRDEEQGRELLQSMMMNDEREDTEPRSKNGEEEEEKEEATNTGRSPDRTAAENAGDEQLPFSEEIAEHSDASQPAYGSPMEEPETRGESDANESDLSRTIVAEFEEFLAGFQNSDGAPAAEPLAVSPPAPEMTDEGTSPGCSSPSPPAATQEDTTGAGGGGDEHSGEVPSPPVAQVPWRAPPQLSRHMDTSRATVEPALPQRTPWVQPRRIGGVAIGVSSFSANAAGIPSPPFREAQLRDGNDVAQGLPDADEMPSPRELPLFPSETVQRVVWRPPGRFAGASPAGTPAPSSSSPSSSSGFPDRLSEGLEEEQIPPQVLHLPLKIAGLLGEGAAANPPAAGVDVSGDRPHVPWKPPNRLAPSPPPAQHVVPPSSSSSMERPSNERDESAETERAALPLCRSFTRPSPDERDDAPDHQWKNLLYNATRFVPTVAETEGGAAGEEGNRTEETGVEPQSEATGHPQGDSQGREEQRAVDGRQDITSRGGDPVDEQRPRRSRDDFRPSARSSRPRSRSGSPRRPSREGRRPAREGDRSSSRSGQRRDSYGHHERPRSRDRYSRREPGVDYCGRSLSRGSSNSSSSRSGRRGEGYDYHHRRDDFSSRRGSRDERGYNSLQPPPGDYGWGAKRPRWEESRPSHRDWGR